MTQETKHDEPEPILGGFEAEKRTYENILDDLHEKTQESPPGSPKWLDAMEAMEIYTIKLQYLKIREELKGIIFIDQDSE